jgi:hypothetical protein
MQNNCDEIVQSIFHINVQQHRQNAENIIRLSVKCDIKIDVACTKDQSIEARYFYAVSARNTELPLSMSF